MVNSSFQTTFNKHHGGKQIQMSPPVDMKRKYKETKEDPDSRKVIGERLRGNKKTEE